VIEMRIWMLIMLVAGCDPIAMFDNDSPEPTRRSYERDREPPPPTERKPLQIEWTKDTIGNSKGTIQGGGEIEVSGYKGKYHITMRDLPKWSKWKTGTQNGKTNSSLELVDVEIIDKIANLTWKELDAVDPMSELELELQDGRTGKTKLPPIGLGYTVREMLKTVENAPLQFGKEPDDPKKQDSLYWPDGISDKQVYGKAGKLYEIDWVLVVHKLGGAKGTKTCSGYQNQGKPMPDIMLQLKETEATIFDRRTGDVVEKKVFAPGSECPMFTFQREGDPTTDSSTPYFAIESWVRTRIRR
jgi:hypothetical protein